MPKSYLVLEPIAGFLRTGPITWLFPVPLFLAARHVLRLRLAAWKSTCFARSALPRWAA
jgi:hypothetical protein